MEQLHQDEAGNLELLGAASERLPYGNDDGSEDDDDEEEDEDESEEEIEDDPDPPVRLLGAYDEGRMMLSDEEREWAREIKAAAAQIPDIDTMSDFMYAQIAIVTLKDPTEANLATALERIGRIQEYQKDHKIPTSYNAICNLVTRTFQDVVPGHYMSFSYHQAGGSYVVAIDMRKFGRNVLQDREKLTSWVGTAWMLYVAQQPDFEAIRNGVTYLFECSDYDWKDKDMFNISCTKLITELESIYPVHVQSMRFYNAGMFLNLLLSMSRRMLPPQISRKFHVKGYDPQRGYLDQLFVAPNLESTNQRNLARVRNALQIRFDNEASFSLD